MTSGKSLIGKKLAQTLDCEFIDLDEWIEKKEKLKISEIFKKRGEIYFRKLEHETLKTLVLDTKRNVISLGGGTPCYSNNLDLLINKSDLKTLYLKVSMTNLVDRLFKEKKNRPLVSHIKTKEELTEFVGKHLFERIPFYTQAEFTIDADRTENEIIESILFKLF